MCMTAAISYPVLVLFTESRELGEIATPFYMFVSAVVGAYIGFATMDDRWQKEPRRGGYKDWRNDIESEDYRDHRRG